MHARGSGRIGVSVAASFKFLSVFCFFGGWRLQGGAVLRGLCDHTRYRVFSATSKSPAVGMGRKVSLVSPLGPLFPRDNIGVNLQTEARKTGGGGGGSGTLGTPRSPCTALPHHVPALSWMHTGSSGHTPSSAGGRPGTRLHPLSRQSLFPERPRDLWPC